jgi:hypothetical protein
MKPYRELLLEIQDVDTAAEAFRMAITISENLKDGRITHPQYENLAHELRSHCKINEIATSNEIASLF